MNENGPSETTAPPRFGTNHWQVLEVRVGQLLDLEKKDLISPARQFYSLIFPPAWWWCCASCAKVAYCKVTDGDTDCPLQVCQLSRSSESTHFLFVRRDVALFDSTRAPDSFWDRRHMPPIYFLTSPNIKRQPYHAKPIQMVSNSDNDRPFEAVS